MSPAKVHASVMRDRLQWVTEMVDGIKHLPYGDTESFLADPRNVAAAESYLRRALEALLDLGRHIAAKGYGVAATEYRAVPDALERAGVLTAEEASSLRLMAGYRNRMVHFYAEVTPRELADICADHLGDMAAIADAYERWAQANPGRIDATV
jgi:uncharacterized protein YutE (UPF0331/DUF86 family)